MSTMKKVAPLPTEQKANVTVQRQLITLPPEPAGSPGYRSASPPTEKASSSPTCCPSAKACESLASNNEEGKGIPLTPVLKRRWISVLSDINHLQQLGAQLNDKVQLIIELAAEQADITIDLKKLVNARLEGDALVWDEVS